MVSGKTVSLFMHKSLLTFGIALAMPLIVNAQSAGPQAGQKVAFMGDSITANGWAHTAGYVHLIAKALEDQSRKIEVIPAGVSGNTSKDMLARLDRDVLSKKPDWMTLSCGVNDVWHGANGVPLDEYQKNITSIVDQATAAGIKVVLLTSTMIGEDQANPNNQKLIAYNEFLHSLAKEKNLPIAELNADMQAAVTAALAESSIGKGKQLTDDGVHMNGIGDQIMAAGVLKAFGFTDAQLDHAKATWMDMPNAMRLSPKTLTVHEYLLLRKIADSQNQTVDDLITSMIKKDVQTLSTNSPAPASP